jgi:hypothetical protein
MHAAFKVKRGRLLILDNAARDYYTHPNENASSKLRMTEFFGLGPTTRTVWHTDVYRRL